MLARLGWAVAARDGIAADNSKAIANPSATEIKPRREALGNKMAVLLDVQMRPVEFFLQIGFYIFRVGKLK